MVNIISIIISLLALIISLITFWVLYLYRGKIKMTQPTFVAFCYDGELYEDNNRPKIYLRSLIFNTSKRGNIIENIFIKVTCIESVQIFNIWAYGGNDLSRGSGMHVSENNVAYNHHFLLPAYGTNYEFLPGDYKIEVYATILNTKKYFLLRTLNLTLSSSQAKNIKERKAVYFDWAPNTKMYLSSTHESPALRKQKLLEELKRKTIEEFISMA